MLRDFEKRNIYFPEKDIEIDPSYLSLPFEEVFFKTSDGLKINAWFIPADEAKITFLFAHGNAGNISHRLEKIALFHRLGVNVFIFDYRGYGKSEGEPDEQGLYLDAKAAYDYLILEKGVNPRDIFLYGESLGGAVVIDLANKQEVGGVITEGTFTCVREMVKVIYPFLPSILFKSKFDSLSKIKNIKAPKLIIHSSEDEMIPFEFAERLFQVAPPPKYLLRLEGGHNSAFLTSREKFRQGIENFLKGLR